MKSRLTFHDPSGRFGVDGENLDRMSPKLYGCICKLRAYEDTGLSPEEVENMKYRTEDLERMLACRADKQ